MAHEPCVISTRARARSRVRAWGALRATWRISSAVPPQRAQSTRNTKPDPLRSKGIRWERPPSIQGPHTLEDFEAVRSVFADRALCAQLDLLCARARKAAA